jgi:hypothetical protein
MSIVSSKKFIKQLCFEIRTPSALFVMGESRRTDSNPSVERLLSEPSNFRLGSIATIRHFQNHSFILYWHNHIRISGGFATGIDGRFQ